MEKKCYDCKYRGGVAGSCHSSCKHPDNEGNFLGNPKSLNIKADPHGVKSGWFMWPFNFDPTWLRNCDGFEEEK